MSRPGSFSTVSSGITQLLQKVLIPRATGLSNQSWTARAELSNIGMAHIDTLYVSQLNASNISADIGATIGDRTTGVAIAGDGSQQGDFLSLTNTTGLGTEVLGLDTNHGTIERDVFVGTRSGQQACNITDSVLIGYLAGLTASGVAGTVAIGTNALYAGSGSNNVYIGSNAISFSNVGSGNVFLGAGVGSNQLTTSNTLLIGNPSAILLRGDFANGRLGVNLTGAPSATLDVSGRAYIRGDVVIDGAPSVALDVSGRAYIRGDVVIDGDLTVSGGPIGSDVCTGQVVIGVGATSSNYQSLISRIGGLQVCNGYLQLNRTEFPFQYHLDVSGTARITGSNLIGGVTLSSSDVFTTGTISGTFANGPTTNNSIGGITISSTNLVTSGTISGLFRNSSTTSNSIGGVSLSGGAISNVASAFSVIGGMPMTSNEIRNVSLVQLSVPGFNYLRGNLGYDNGGGYLTLVRSSDSATTITISGSSGAITNNAGSSNSIGGVTLGPNGKFETQSISANSFFGPNQNTLIAAPSGFLQFLVLATLHDVVPVGGFENRFSCFGPVYWTGSNYVDSPFLFDAGAGTTDPYISIRSGSRITLATGSSGGGTTYTFSNPGSSFSNIRLALFAPAIVSTGVGSYRAEFV